MKSRVLLAVLVGISLVLAVINHARHSVNARLAQSLDMFDRLPKAERDRFLSNAMEFYQNHSKTARDERTRLRHLYHKIKNDPDSERLKETMEQYVDWVSRFSDPATMRMLQNWSIDARVEAIQKAIRDERQINAESPISTERLKDTLRDKLDPKLWYVSSQTLTDAFDHWLTQKYAEAKSGLNDEQKKLLNDLPVFEQFYRNLFGHAGMEPSASDALEIPEKLALLQLLQNLNASPPPQMPGGDFPQRGGIMRQFGARSPWYEFLEKINDAMEYKETKEHNETMEYREAAWLVPFDDSAGLVLLQMDRPARLDALQRMLALAVLKSQPAIVPGRFSRPGRELPMEILGVYLSMMTAKKREEYLKQDSRFTLNQLQGELWFNTMAYYSLFRPRPSGMGPPMEMPPSPRGNPPPPKEPVALAAGSDG